MKKLKNFKWGYPLLFLLTASLGVLFLLFRETLTVLAVSVGVILILFAILYAVCTMADRERGFLFALKMVLSVLVLTAGIVVLIARAATMTVILSLFAFLILLDGAFKLQTTVLSKRYRLFGWWFLLVLSLLMVIGGGILFRFLDRWETGTAAILLGLLLIVDGIANLFTAFFLSGYEGRMRKEILAAAASSQPSQADPADTPAGESHPSATETKNP